MFRYPSPNGLVISCKRGQHARMATKLSYDFFIPSAFKSADFSPALQKLLATPMHQRRVDYGAFYLDVPDAEAGNAQTVGLVSRHRMQIFPPTGDPGPAALDRLT